MTSDERIRYVQEMLDHVRLVILPRLSSRRDLVPRQYAAAALARIARLLTAMILLREREFPDVVGLPLRPILECWWLGMYFLLAPDEAMAMTHAAHGFQLQKLNRDKWGDVDAVLAQMHFAPRQGTTWKQVSDRVGDLYAASGTQEGRVASANLYETLYRGESMMSVHAGAALLVGHFDDQRPTRFDVMAIRREPDDGAIRILAGSSLLETLARAVAGNFGISFAEIDRLGSKIRAGETFA